MGVESVRGRPSQGLRNPWPVGIPTLPISLPIPQQKHTITNQKQQSTNGSIDKNKSNTNDKSSTERKSNKEKHDKRNNKDNSNNCNNDNSDGTDTSLIISSVTSINHSDDR